MIGGLAGADPADRRLRPAGDGWWERSYELPRDVRTAYWFTNVLVPGGQGDLIPDPLNPRRHVYAADPETGDEEMAASLVELPGAAPLRWSVPRVSVPRGKLITINEIRARIASFRAHQERFNRERADYFSATLARLRAAIDETPTPRV